MSGCGYDGEALVALIQEAPVWVRSDDKVHVTAEVVALKHPTFLERYEVGEWCAEFNAYHADRLDR